MKSTFIKLLLVVILLFVVGLYGYWKITSYKEYKERKGAIEQLRIDAKNGKMNTEEEIPFDSDKLDSKVPYSSLEDAYGTIRNQYWISSDTILENEVKKIILSKRKLLIIAYRQYFGFLIEFDDFDPEAMKDFDELKAVEKLEYHQRMYTGKNIDKNLSK